MAKYIDAEAAKADGWYIQRSINTLNSATIETRDITTLPAADVIEVEEIDSDIHEAIRILNWVNSTGRLDYSDYCDLFDAICAVGEGKK